MGGSITVENDLTEKVSVMVSDKKGKTITGWDISIKPGQTYERKGDGFQPGKEYKLIYASASITNNRSAIFYAFKNPDISVFEISKLKEQLASKELDYLLNQVLPGVRIDTHTIEGKKYPESFLSDALLAHLVIHAVGADMKEAIVKCTRLQDSKVFLPFNKDFTGEFRPGQVFKLNIEHKLVKQKGRLKSDLWNKEASESSSDLEDQGPTRFAMTTFDRTIAYREWEGWMEKKSRLGFWQRRYCRITISKDNKNCSLDDGIIMNYYENDFSLTAKGSLKSSEILQVELVENSTSRRAFKLITKNNRPQTFRAPNKKTTDRWLRILKQYSKSYSNFDIVSMSALVFVFTGNMLREFSKRLKEVEYSSNQWICRAGEDADDFYLLKEGKIGIYIPDETHGEKFLCFQQPICHFGESAFNAFEDEVPIRTASIMALEDSKVLVLQEKDRLVFMRLFGLEPEDMADMLQLGITELLRQVPFLTNINDRDLDKLQLGMRYQSLEAGQTLFNEGDAGHDFYIIYDGEMNIARYDFKSQKEQILKTVGKSDYFGEIALMVAGMPRTATVVAKTKTLLVSLNEKTFQHFVKAANLDMAAIMRQRIVFSFKKFKIPFFEAIPTECYHELATECKIEQTEANQVIFRAGDPGDKFYMIFFGEVSIVVKGNEVGKLQTGKYFGEVALVVEDTPRTATCITTVQTVLLSMSKASFRKFFEERPEALADVELKIAGRKCHIKSVILHPLGVELFSEFLKKEYAHENMEFWLDARAYRKWASGLTEPEDLKKRHDEAMRIVDKYIRIDSEQQINLIIDMVKEIIKEVEEGKEDEKTFAKVEEEVVKLMNAKLGAFKQTKAFDDLMGSCGGYFYDKAAKGGMDSKVKNLMKARKRRS